MQAARHLCKQAGGAQVAGWDRMAARASEGQRVQQERRRARQGQTLDDDRTYRQLVRQMPYRELAVEATAAVERKTSSDLPCLNLACCRVAGRKNFAKSPGT